MSSPAAPLLIRGSVIIIVIGIIHVMLVPTDRFLLVTFSVSPSVTFPPAIPIASITVASSVSSHSFGSGSFFCTSPPLSPLPLVFLPLYFLCSQRLRPKYGLVVIIRALDDGSEKTLIWARHIRIGAEKTFDQAII